MGAAPWRATPHKCTVGVVPASFCKCAHVKTFIDLFDKSRVCRTYTHAQSKLGPQHPMCLRAWPCSSPQSPPQMPRFRFFLAQTLAAVALQRFYAQVLKLRAVGYDVGVAAQESIAPAEYAAQHAKVTLAKETQARE